MTSNVSLARAADRPPRTSPPVAATERGEDGGARPVQCEFVTDWQMPQPVIDDVPAMLIVGHGHLVQTAIRPVLQELPAGIADCLSR